MAQLIAQGHDFENRWRKNVPLDQAFILGREAGEWSVAWDAKISRRHLELLWDGQCLRLRRLSTARNPVFVRGKEIQECQLGPGQHFVIGRTTFTFTQEQVVVARDAPEPRYIASYSAADLRQVPFQRADWRIDSLVRLPEVIHSAANEQELLERLVTLLLHVRGADAAAIVQQEWLAADSPPSTTENAQTNPTMRTQVLHWDRRSLAAGQFRPSGRLIQAALLKQQTILHRWLSLDESLGYTMSEQDSWAFCVPIPSQTRSGWVLYLTGGSRVPPLPAVAPTNAGREPALPVNATAEDPELLRDDLKYAEIVAATLGSLLDLRDLTQRQATLGAFFSPRVRQLLAARDSEQALQPRETAVTVLFCDLRGFSRKSELAAANLLNLLERVSEALGIMTRHILAQGGVVSDFQGDSAMGFWGWPFAEPAAPLAACRAALAIRRDFAALAGDPAHPLADFQVGIGLASGLAVAGKIGTRDQAQVTAFGPVVNLAKRLESLTRRITADILLDRATAQAVENATSGELCYRPLATVQPYGWEQGIPIGELLDVEDEGPQAATAKSALAEKIEQLFTSGDWAAARSLVVQLPPHDPQRQLMEQCWNQLGSTVPGAWAGKIELTNK
ncbi:MAG: adenylate/guanylate cyclase domain-containing protein [Pirellulales bacterium]|nr:adenylate/guanylate cyclase domain-containing protein [Pirellulales bacterium]